MTSEILLQIFPLFCIAVTMVIVCVQDYKAKPFQSRCFLLIVLINVLLTLFVELERVGTSLRNVPLATVSCFFGYALRPICLYMFILLAVKRWRKWEWVWVMPLILSALVYSSSLFLNVPALRDLAFHYEFDATGEALTHVRGPMNFTSHVLSILYLLYLLYISLKKLRGKHRSDALSIMLCAFFIVGAVIIEMLGLAIGVLNLTIAVSCIFYYLFLLREDIRRDALTDLFDRKTYFSDLERFKKDVSGVIQIDMNGLKGINDTKGHLAGDEAIRTVARTIKEKTTSNMYVYRVGGDEFTVVVYGARRPMEVTVTGIKQALDETGYSCAIGYATCEDGVCTIQQAIKNADVAMYEDKSRFYKEHPEKNRRQR